jgi:hypothetical protein
MDIVRKHEGRRPLKKIWHEYKDNIKMNFKASDAWL